MTPRRLARIGVATGMAAGLFACTPPPAPTGAGRADAARQAACQRHADQIYAEQNRSAIYLDDSQQSLSPQSGSYVEGNPSRGLPTAYRQQELVSDCIRNTDAAGAPPAPAGREREGTLP